MTKLVVALATALVAIPAPDAGAAQLPDAEIFAASTTEIITDLDDPRLDVRLVGFNRTVKGIVKRRGGKSRGSTLTSNPCSPSTTPSVRPTRSTPSSCGSRA